MKMNKVIWGVLSVSAVLLSGCTTPKNVTYFQNLANGQVVQADQIFDIKVRPEDKLSIIVNTQDPALSSLFNLVQAQTQIQNSTTSTVKVGDIASSGGGRVSYYTVTPAGTIFFPVLGELSIAGMRRYEVAEFIRNKLIEEDLVKDPIVTVEFANMGISVLGEVKSPGRYEFNKDRLTIIDAIAMAGDLTLNGQRTDILVLRQTDNGKEQAYFVDMTDTKNVYSSPVFYLQQDDVIYVAPNDKVKRETTPNGNTPFTPSFWVSLGSFAITIATLAITLSK